MGRGRGVGGSLYSSLNWKRIVFLTSLASLTVSGVLGWPSLSHSLPTCSPGLLFPTPSDRVAAPVADFPRDLLGFLPHPGVCAGEIDFLLDTTDCFHFIYPLWKLDFTTCVLFSPPEVLLPSVSRTMLLNPDPRVCSRRCVNPLGSCGSRCLTVELSGTFPVRTLGFHSILWAFSLCSLQEIKRALPGPSQCLRWVFWDNVCENERNSLFPPCLEKSRKWID